MSDDWLLWQLLDSAFPSGSFPHSGGLEAAYQFGTVVGGKGLDEFIDAQLRTVARSIIPFLRAAHTAPANWANVDCALDLFLNNHVANKASRGQGGAFLVAAERVFGLPRIIELRAQVRAMQLPGHVASVLGAVLAALGVNEIRACQILFFLTVRGTISSAVRLGLVGPMEGQSIQYALRERVAHWEGVAMSVTIDEAAQTSPLLDLLQGTQDRLYSRLFQS